MTPRSWRAEVQLSSDVKAEERQESQLPDPDRRFLILVMGDFRGRQGTGAAGDTPVRERPFVRIDRDDFDSVMARFGVRWNGSILPFPGDPRADTAVSLAIPDIDGFHPDRLVTKIPLLKEIRALLPRLRDKAGQDDAESFLRKKLAPAEQGAAAPPPAPAAKAAAPRLGEGRPGPGLLDSILDQSGAPGAPPAGIADRALEQWVQEIMAPHRILVDAAREETLRSKLNRLLSVQVNAVLHQPGFQRLESAWRSLYRMVRNVETGPRLQIRIVQLEKDEILSDVLSGRRLEDSELACTMVDRTSVAGSDRPTLLVGDYEFSAGLEDMAVLERLGILAARMGATFVAGAAPEMVGRNSFEVLGTPADLERLFRDDAYGPWRLLRKSGAARRLALGLPRVLCRLPYGPDCDPAETFDFREDILGLRHERLLWGNPAYLVASVYAAAFSAHGWQRDPATTVPKVDGLPLYLRRSDGETVAQPCAEVLLTERMAESLMEAGFLPLVSHRGTDVVSLPSLQTIADPRRPIRWNGD